MNVASSFYFPMCVFEWILMGYLMLKHQGLLAIIQVSTMHLVIDVNGNEIDM